jgi:hypothetical protein
MESLRLGTGGERESLRLGVVVDIRETEIGGLGWREGEIEVGE